MAMVKRNSIEPYSSLLTGRSVLNIFIGFASFLSFRYACILPARFLDTGENDMKNSWGW